MGERAGASGEGELRARGGRASRGVARLTLELCERVKTSKRRRHLIRFSTYPRAACQTVQDVGPQCSFSDQEIVQHTRNDATANCNFRQWPIALMDCRQAPGIAYSRFFGAKRSWQGSSCIFYPTRPPCTAREPARWSSGGSRPRTAPSASLKLIDAVRPTGPRLLEPACLNGADPHNIFRLGCRGRTTLGRVWRCRRECGTLLT